MIIPVLLIILNIIFGIDIARRNMQFYVKSNGVTWKWIKLAYAISGVYWAVVYISILISEGYTHTDYTWYGEILVRPGITIMLAIIEAGAILKDKTDAVIGHNYDRINGMDIKKVGKH